MTSKASLPEYSTVARWTVNDVCNWLMENKFSNFVPMFREAGVDGCRLASTQDLDLRRMKCPNNKSLDLLRCIDNIQGKDDARNRRPPAAAPAINHRPPPSLPQSKHNGSIDDDEDEYSGPDDDYEWNDFDEQPSSDSDSDLDYENNPDKRPPPSKPAKKSGSSGSDYDQPDVPPPRPTRPGQSGANRLPPPLPNNQRASPSPGRRGRQPAPVPVPEPEQPEYEDPNEAPPPSVPQRPGGRPPQALPPRPGPGGRKTAPPPVKHPPEPEETYEDPDADPRPPPPRPDARRPPPSKGGRGRQPLPEPTPPPPMDEPQELYEDPDAPPSEPTSDDFYEDPDAQPEPPPSRPSFPKHNVPKPSGGRGKPPPLPVNRTNSHPDLPAPPVPRHHQKREPAKLPPPPSRGKRAPTPESDDDQDDYEKPAPESRPPPPRPGRPAPDINDLPGYMEMAPKEDEQQEEYEVPDPDLTKPTSTPPRPTHLDRKKREVPSVPTEPEEKEKCKQPYKPVGGVPLLPSPVTNGTPTKSESDGKGGSVLSRPLPSEPTSEDEHIKDYPWFHDVTRQVADRDLQKYSKNGMFLVRRSTKPSQPFTLVIFNNTNIYNLPIRRRDDGQFALGKFKKDENSYDHVADLVEFFKTHTLILAAGGSQTRLKHSLPR